MDFNACVELVYCRWRPKWNTPSSRQAFGRKRRLTHGRHSPIRKFDDNFASFPSWDDRLCPRRNSKKYFNRFYRNDEFEFDSLWCYFSLNSSLLHYDYYFYAEISNIEMLLLLLLIDLIRLLCETLEPCQIEPIFTVSRYLLIVELMLSICFKIQTLLADMRQTYNQNRVCPYVKKSKESSDPESIKCNLAIEPGKSYLSIFTG